MQVKHVHSGILNVRKLVEVRIQKQENSDLEKLFVYFSMYMYINILPVFTNLFKTLPLFTLT
jgi:hypothetical protein